MTFCRSWHSRLLRRLLVTASLPALLIGILVFAPSEVQAAQPTVEPGDPGAEQVQRRRRRRRREDEAEGVRREKKKKPKKEPEAVPEPVPEPEATPTPEPPPAPPPPPSAPPPAKPENTPPAPDAPPTPAEPIPAAAPLFPEDAKPQQPPAATQAPKSGPVINKGPEVINAAPPTQGLSPAPGSAAPAPETGAPKVEAAVPAGKMPDDGSPKFIRGDLIYPGTRRLLSRFNHIGVAFGPALIGSELFASIDPGFALYMDNGLAMSMHMPLNLLAIDGVEGKKVKYGGLKLRREDWDSASDYFQIIRFLTYGRKEDRYYVSINTMRPATIGHGMVMKGYQGNVDVDRSMTGVIFDMSTEYGGFEFQANDITFQNQVIGVLGFIKPFSFFGEGLLAKTFSIGPEYIADFNAPKCVIRNQSPNDLVPFPERGCIEANGHVAGDSQFLDGTFAKTDTDTGLFQVERANVHAMGLSAEVKLYKDERNIDIKAFTVWHKFLNAGGGHGLSLGVLARLNAGTRWISAFRIQGEFRTFGDGYIPNYFNTQYETHKFNYQPTQRNFQATPTKFQHIFGDPDNGFARPSNGQRYGFNLEASWGLFKGSRRNKEISLGFGVSDSSGPNDTNFYAHLEFPMLEILQIFGTYMRTDIASFSDVFKANAATAPDSIVLTGLRLQVLPVMFINAHYSRSYQITRSPGSEYHIGNDLIVDGNGNPSPTFQLDTVFDNVQTLFAEIEFGWEWE